MEAGERVIGVEPKRLHVSMPCLHDFTLLEVKTAELLVQLRILGPLFQLCEDILDSFRLHPIPSFR